MADSFFGFDTDFPVHGTGKMGELDNDLVKASEDEEGIDLMNDETFGDGAEFDEDWEEVHDKMAGELESFHEPRRANGHDYYHHNGDHHENMKDDLEQSLSQLVVDDEDELEDTAIRTASKHQPIPMKSHMDLDQLFGPSSPPGFLNTEHLVSPGRNNIWGSPAREEYPNRQEESVKNLLSMLHQQQQQKQQQQQAQPKAPLQDPCIVMAGKTIPPPGMPQQLPPSAPTPPIPMPANQPAQFMRPRAMTVEELEREMRSEPAPMRRNSQPPSHQQTFGQSPTTQPFGQSPTQQFGQSPSQPGLPLPIGTPPHGQLMHQQPQGILRRSSTGRISPKPDFTSQGLSLSANAGLGHGQSPPNDMQQKGVLSQRLQNANQNKPSPPFLANTPVQQRMPYPTAATEPIHNRTRHNSQPFPPNTQVPPPPLPSLANTGQSPGGGHPSNSNNHKSHPANIRQQLYSKPSAPYHQYHQQRYQQRDSWQQYGGRGRGRGHHHGNRSFHRQQSWDDEEDEDVGAGGDRDQYANLMTQKEKDWIIKIQLMQLHTENPYVDDYYYTTWMMRKMIKERQKQREDGASETGKMNDSDPQLLLPQLAKVENKSYKPVQFIGSLGRLTASSVHNPRQIIDVRSDSLHDSEDPRAKQTRRYKQLLLTIEEMYDILLDIDDIEKKALALPEDARAPLFVQRHQKIQDLYCSVKCTEETEEHFLMMASVNKGIKLMIRTMPLLDKTSCVCLICDVLTHLREFIKREHQLEAIYDLFTTIAVPITKAPLEVLVTFSQALVKSSNTENDSSTSKNQTNTLDAALHSKLGASIVWGLINHAEIIFDTTSPVDMDLDHQNSWLEFVQQVADAVAISEDKLMEPYRPMEKVLAHMQRHLDKKMVLSIEDALHPVMTPKLVDKPSAIQSNSKRNNIKAS